MHSFAPSLSFLLSFLLLPRLLVAADLRGLTAREAPVADSASLTQVESAGGAPEPRALELELAARQPSGHVGSGASSNSLRRRHADLLRGRSITNTTAQDLDAYAPNLLYPGRRAANARFSWFVTGLGACGRTNAPSDFVVALNKEQFDAGDHCFETVTITVRGKTTRAQIVDRCELCGYNGLDFTQGLFNFFGGDGIIYGDWEYGSGAPSPSPTPKATTTTSKATPKPTTTSMSTTSSVSTTTRASTSSQSDSTSSTVSTSTASAPTPTLDQSSNLQQLYLASLGMGGVIMRSLDTQI
ncbi:unnamed protein product [Cyclocybe aegerita]|uniref:Uncharacterized protein n=1 Tax=Cyclocybe aegerita TaxID=1973307 RepID=A0A8S0VY06_CYCAE|nr:unnamed protein product [Cyclocybe aegerita]